jgi:xanthine dehydrogenase YagR molybdenum-binding subunit
MASSVVGQFVTRIDGSLKVTGRAPYAVEHDIPGLVFGYGIASTIGAGRVTFIDSAAAEKMPGVLAVLHHGNVEPLFRPANSFEANSRAGESRPPFEDENVFYYGQFVALVVAKTFEQAMAAASAVKVDYEVKEPIVELTGPNAVREPKEADNYSRGDAASAFASAPVKFEATYTTPTETHNAMEMHGTIAVWKDKKLTLYETTQGVVNHHNVASEMLGVPLESIEVISPFIGSGFGSKLFPWPHSFLAAIAARHVNLPVKVSVPRTLMFTTVGHRPHTQQKIQLGADADGKLVALNHEILQGTSMVDDFVENCVEVTSMLYSCPNLMAANGSSTSTSARPHLCAALGALLRSSPWNRPWMSSPSSSTWTRLNSASRITPKWTKAPANPGPANISVRLIRSALKNSAGVSATRGSAR